MKPREGRDVRTGEDVTHQSDIVTGCRGDVAQFTGDDGRSCKKMKQFFDRCAKILAFLNLDQAFSKFLLCNRDMCLAKTIMKMQK